jgi:murein DD-endopeptidase MepM/ murein hydrolase activator NlpD
MARRVGPNGHDGGGLRGATVALFAIGALIVLAGGSVFLAGGGATAAPSASATGAAGVSSPSPRPGSAVPRSPGVETSPAASGTPIASLQPTPAPTTRQTPSPTSSPNPNAAPRTAAEFDIADEVIDIAFPLRSETKYHYRDNFFERRAGPPDPYNHARLTDGGTWVRLHDGIDIYGPEGEPVVAPFAGRVIDPATRWTPWEPDRYGLTVVIESDEATSDGYAAILVHLERVWVDVGQSVSRGQVIGVLGRSGNAEEVAPQLHFELRAPFMLDWSSRGEDRQVDAFDPYPSLLEADPHR